MTDEAIQLYFLDAAEAALVDAENFASQNRKARAQDSLTTARYFAAKCKNEDLRPDFEERLTQVALKCN